MATVLESLPREVKICIRNAAIACVADDYWDLRYHITAAVKAHCNMLPGADVATRPLDRLVEDMAKFTAIAFVLSQSGIPAQHSPTDPALRALFDGLPPEKQALLRTDQHRRETDLLIKLTEDVA